MPSPTRVPAGRSEDVVERLVAELSRREGRDAVLVGRAPGRVNLIGEHLDYNGSLCLPLALPHSTWAALAPRDDGRLVLASLQQDDVWEGTVSNLEPGSVEGWAAYVAGVWWALREAGHDLPGADVVVDSTVPTGAGLSSSAALECSVALGLAALVGLDDDEATRELLLAACIRAETDMAGAPTGGLDQSASLFCAHGEALLLDFGGDTRVRVPWEPEASGLRLLVVDTRASHTLTDGGYGDRRGECEEAARRLGVATLGDVARAEDPDALLADLDDDVLRRRARHVVTETDRTGEVARLLGDSLGTDDWHRIGALFDASHASMRDDYEISCAELDAVCEAAGSAGALGARMTGGGFGGSAIALVEGGREGDVADAVLRAFAEAGWDEPRLLEAPASAAAEVLRL